jgi:hypothetical protein
MSNNYKNLTDYIDELICDYATRVDEGFDLDYDHLPISKHNVLTALYIEYKGIELIDEALANDLLRSDVFWYMRKFECNEDFTYRRESIASMVSASCVMYCEKNIKEIIDERCVALEDQLHIDAGENKVVDQVTGDLYWVKGDYQHAEGF